MCFYDQYRMLCGDYKWSHFRQHCAKEYRTSKICGTKLVMSTIPKAEKCKICSKIEVKENRMRKEQEKIERWHKEDQQGHQRGASIEASTENISRLWEEINSLAYKRQQSQISTR
ncbi:hypothetical protein B0J14DRAFT_604701 [Halenospora varia]|nr:hypothetical protein B0J14DRAFT_604701 [Halenospora varia]